MSDAESIHDRWRRAAIVLGYDGTAQCPCPVCQRGPLRVTDVPFVLEPRRFERHLQCDRCGARSAMRMGPDARTDAWWSTTDELLDAIVSYVDTISALIAHMNTVYELSSRVDAAISEIAAPLWAARWRSLPRRGRFVSPAGDDVQYHIRAVGIDFVLERGEFGCDFHPIPLLGRATHATHIAVSVTRIHRFLSSRLSPPPRLEVIGAAMSKLHHEGKLLRSGRPRGGEYGGGFYLPERGTHTP